MTWLILIACLLGMVSGTREAMIFIQPHDIMYDHWNSSVGVRQHRWFKIYHVLRIVEVILAMIFGKLMFDTSFSLSLKFGALLGLWELFEVFYAYARWCVPLSHEEFIVFLDIFSFRLKPYATVAIHIIRIIAGISLITWSMI